ncbi:MAG: C10 family peptidase [Prevotella sp.]|nr:C10 family peptidase [Prevotella sp.]
MKKYLMTLAGLLVAMTLTAAPVTRDAARQKALQFLSERGSGVAAARGMQPVDMQLSDAADMEQLYVFNVGRQEGFVIVSGDDCTGDLVLGYADSGEISPATMPDNLRAWLQGYADQIRWMQKNGMKNDVAAARAMTESAARQAVSPLLTTKWDQGAPYNNNCPMYAKDAGGGSYYAIPTVTGCVATATAQIMYYQAVKNGIASTTILKTVDAYNTTKCPLWNKAGNGIGYVVEEKPIATINWADITGVTPTTTEAQEAVALLMEYIGAGVQMNYGTTEMGGSSASNSDVPDMLINYFGYDSDAKTIYRNDYSYVEWIDALYQELSTNGPVFFGGTSLGGGHAFVLDGYSEADFFHVNWGWGGLSDGFFRLSALNPDTQGIGASTTADGYNLDQSAMINVKPIDDGVTPTDEIRLTVNRFENTRTPNYRHSNGDFYNLVGSTLYSFRLDYKFTNNTGKGHRFDWRMALYQDDTQLQVLGTGGDDDDYSEGMYMTGYNSYTFGSGLSDGEYRLVPVCRETGSEIWYPCYDSDLNYIKATIVGDNLTLENISQDRTPNLTATLSLSGSAIVDNPVTMIARISNTGYKYNGKIQIWKKVGGNYYVVAARQIDVENGADEKAFELSFVPTEVGTLELYLVDKDDTPLTATSITVENPTATTGSLSISASDITFNNSVGTFGYVGFGFYGPKMSGQVNVTNSSASNVHESGITLKVWQYNGVNYSYLTKKTYPTNIPANGGTQLIEFEFNDLTVGTNYLLTYHYTDGGETEISVPHYSIPCSMGITTYLADGTTNTIAPTSTVVVADDVLALDITDIDAVTSVTPNSNPNTLYFVGADIPSGLSEQNVVQNGTAVTLTLIDGYGFYSPYDFIATTATYTRRFTVGANGTNGWSTIVVPFDVTTVKQGEKDIDWFHSSSDEGKNFWLKEFASESGSTVNFGFAEELKANTPYIIAVPGNTWGEKWNLTNKDITFIGSAVPVQASAPVGVSGNNYKFAGTMMNKDVTDCYLLNAEGNTFQKTNGSVVPFRAYFQPINLMYATADHLLIGAYDGTTGIDSRLNGQQPTADGIYNLGGQRVTQPGKGLYIIGGKKVIVK